jgi:hypothetical protein
MPNTPKPKAHAKASAAKAAPKPKPEPKADVFDVLTAALVVIEAEKAQYPSPVEGRLSQVQRAINGALDSKKMAGHLARERRG